MNDKKSGFPIVVLAVLFVGLTLSIMQHFTQGNGLQAQPAAANLAQLPTPNRPIFNDGNANPVVIPLNLNAPKAEAPTATPAVQALPTLQPKTDFVFADVVPAADSPEFTADDMNACFSMYTRRKNEAENGCQGEWYPADYAPRPYDEFWCATNNGGVGWVPVRFFDHTSSQTVSPYGSLNQCE
jgi:hypothetical protein